MNNIKNNITLLDILNKIDGIINSYLYSKENGYYNLNDKIAVDTYEEYLSYFNQELSVLIENIDTSAISYIIDFKKSLYINKLDEHYQKELYVWAKNVYKSCLENIVYNVSLNKNDSNLLKLFYHNGISVVNWYCNLLKLSKSENIKLIKAFVADFNNSLLGKNMNKSDYIRPEISDYDTYLNLIEKYRDSKNQYLNINFTQLANKLTSEDINYLSSLKNYINTSLSLEYDDEIDIFLSIVEVYKLKDSKDKYNLFKSIKNDITNLKSSTKNITLKDKIDIAKHRAIIFTDSLNNKSNLNYFKKLITSQM